MTDSPFLPGLCCGFLVGAAISHWQGPAPLSIVIATAVMSVAAVGLYVWARQ